MRSSPVIRNVAIAVGVVLVAFIVLLATRGTSTSISSQIVGQAAPEFARTLDGRAPYVISGDLETATAQAYADAAAATAFIAGADEAVPTDISPTMAEGTAIAQPVRMREVLGALRETDGGAVMLTEAEIGKATLDLARIGIYVEPTCAQAAAAFAKLLETGTITPEQTTVLVMTGTGLKATPRIAELMGVTL